MKVVTLINLGAATRIVHDVRHRPVVIETGDRAEFIEIDDKVHELLSRGQHNDTLILIDPAKFVLPEKMKLVLDLIRRLDDGIESELLNSYGKIFGKAESTKRPNRQVMRANLLKLSRHFCQFTLNKQRSNEEPDNAEVSKPETQPQPPVPSPSATQTPRKNKHRRR